MIGKTIAMAGSVLALTLLAGPPAMAHHSGAMFDATKEITFKAVVKNFEWVNPHIRIQVVGDPAGVDSQKVMLIESTSPGRLTRDGWTRTSLKPGDHIELTVNPSRNGTAIANLKVLTNLDTGRSLRRPPF